ncbi:MAG: 3-oxoacyl-[acyl-carrier-protein] reductase [Opitutales bacterium]
MKLTFNDRVALVTGAGRGIGKEIAISLAKEGCKVVCISRNLASCQSVADEINTLGGFAKAYAFDVASAQESKSNCEEILKDFKKVDIIVNNAGITKDNLMMRMSDAEWDDVINTNLSSCFYLTRNLTRQLLGNRWGRIINITSVSGILGNTGQANYAATKAGLIGFTKTLAREFASRNITCNAIAPGFIETDMTSSLNEKIVEKAKEVIPLKRFGKTEEIAAACVFLASEEASYITGQILSVDGGMAM